MFWPLMFLLFSLLFGRFDFVTFFVVLFWFICFFFWCSCARDFFSHSFFLCLNFSFFFRRFSYVYWSAFHTYYSVHTVHVAHIQVCTLERDAHTHTNTRAHAAIRSPNTVSCACGACNITYYVCRDIGLMQLVFIQCFVQ